jgi:hypothetical protein
LDLVGVRRVRLSEHALHLCLFGGCENDGGNRVPDGELGGMGVSDGDVFGLIASLHLHACQRPCCRSTA